MAIFAYTALVDGNVLSAADINTPLSNAANATVPVANGGTGLTAGTSGGVLAFTATGTVASSIALTAFGVVYGGGAGAAPAATAAGTTGQVLIATTSAAPAFGTPPLPIGHGSGCTIANSGGDPTNDIDIATGAWRDSTNAGDLVLASALTKQLDATWAVGTNAGGKMSAAAIANTTYFVFLIKRVDTGVVDVGFDTSPTAPTMPTNYTLFRRIGSIIRAGGAIVLMLNNADDPTYYSLMVPRAEWQENIAGTTAVTKTLAFVPVGINVSWHGSLGLLVTSTGAVIAVLASDLATTDTTPVPVSTSGIGQIFGAPQAAISHTGGTVRVRVSTAAGIRMRSNDNTNNPAWSGVTLGWWDTAGRL